MLGLGSLVTRSVRTFADVIRNGFSTSEEAESLVEENEYQQEMIQSVVSMASEHDVATDDGDDDVPHGTDEERSHRSRPRVPRQKDSVPDIDETPLDDEDDEEENADADVPDPIRVYNKAFFKRQSEIGRAHV